MKEKILQIIPAEGWYGVIARRGFAEEYPVACWALLEDKEGNRRIVGMGAEACVYWMSAYTNLLGYIQGPLTDNDPEKWHKAANDYFNGR
jgi:hypothetical protein